MGFFDDSKTALAGRMTLSLYIAEQVEAAEVIAEINSAVGTYLFSDYDGKYRYRTYSTPTGASTLNFTQDEVFSFQEMTDATEIVSMIRVEYRYREMADYAQIYVHENGEAQYLKGEPIPILKEARVPFASFSDAETYAQRTALFEGDRQRTFKATVSYRGWILLPADFISLSYVRRGVSATFEVLEVQRNLTSFTVDLVLGAPRGEVPGGGGSGGGSSGQVGHWTEDSVFFPASFGSGPADDWDPGWSDEQRAHVRANYGYWCEGDYAYPGDLNSNKPSCWSFG